MNQYVNRIKTMLSILEKSRYETPIVQNKIYQKTVGYNQRDTMNEAVTEPGWKLFSNGSHWGGREVHDCFKTVVEIPEELRGEEIWMQVTTGATDIWNTDNPQFLIYIDGKIECAMDMNHHEVCITKQAEPGRQIEIGLYAYSNSDAKQDYLSLSMMVKHPEVEQLYYDCKVPFDTAMELRDDDLERIKLIEMLNQVASKLELRKELKTEFLQSVITTRQWLQETFYQHLDHNSDVIVHSIGHTHIDVAWKWPLRQTREKALRSFATVLHLMKDYKEYRFMSSQPQLYEFVKEGSPEIYEQIKERIKEGRWEPEGSMWVEPDCNLTSGESLVRQILYGKRFFAEEFGKKDNVVLWLPDVFGYSAAMPQILKKAGIQYFMTTKINWNEYNKFPNDVMYWTGIDGTEILTYFISTTDHQVYPELIKNKRHETTYNGRQNVSQVMGTWQRFSNKNLTNEVLTCYGYGDGGGGPTAQMLEENRRIEQGMPECPITKQTFSREFFAGLESKLADKKVPRWNGELYLEYHRGTYTSMARNKKYNRQCEFLNSDVEFFAILAGLQNKTYHYPKETLDHVWKLTLLNQFHDILPGSSIEDVYIDSKEQYEEIIQLDRQMIQDALYTNCQDIVFVNTLDNREFLNLNNQELVFYNTSGVAKKSNALITKEQYQILQSQGFTGLVQELTDGNAIVSLPEIPAKGYITSKYLIENVCNQKNTDNGNSASGANRRDGLSEVDITITRKQGNVKNIGSSIFTDTKTGYELETPYYQVIFNQQGEITSLYDKEEKREIQKPGTILNQLIAFEDKPYEYDAWNIDSYYEEKSWNISDLTSLTLEENGPLLCKVRVTRPFMNSTIQQDICFYTNKKRIDFQTTIDWKEEQILLKAAFPIDVLTSKIICDIQFGNVERPTHRNTSWDEAKFEVCAHKWVDLAENGYGVALLNDCKYGLDVLDTTVRLTLLKSGIFPNPNADKELHQFTYSLYPHTGDFRQGAVVPESFDLNQPIYTTISNNKPLLGDTFNAVRANCPNVVLDTLKQSEDNNDLILRMYEYYGKRTQLTCDLTALNPTQVIACDLLEKPTTDNALVPIDKGKINFQINPYEILTFRIKTQ